MSIYTPIDGTSGKPFKRLPGGSRSKFFDSRPICINSREGIEPGVLAQVAKFLPGKM